MNADFESKFKLCIKKIEKTGNAYSEAKGQSWQMQELRSSVLSKIIKSSTETSLARAEVDAKSSNDYEQYVKETAKAITNELKLKAEYEKWKSYFEALRSLCSLEKSTQKEIGE